MFVCLFVCVFVCLCVCVFVCPRVVNPSTGLGGVGEAPFFVS